MLFIGLCSCCICFQFVFVVQRVILFCVSWEVLVQICDKLAAFSKRYWKHHLRAHCPIVQMIEDILWSIILVSNKHKYPVSWLILMSVSRRLKRRKNISMICLKNSVPKPVKSCLKDSVEKKWAPIGICIGNIMFGNKMYFVHKSLHLWNFPFSNCSVCFCNWFSSKVGILFPELIPH